MAETLRDLVIRRLIELGHDGKRLAYKPAALKSGGRVSHEIIRNIANGTHSGNLRDETVLGLSMALDVPEERIYRAAQIPRPGQRWRWPERFDRLREEDRRVVEATAGAILAAYERGRRGE